MAIGPEVPTPASSVWKVWDGKEYFYYSFLNDSRVFWCTAHEMEQVVRLGWRHHDDSLKKTVTDADRRGKWRLDNEVMRIQWTDEYEAWDLPLCDGYQTGVAVRSPGSGFGFPIPGRPGPDGTAGDIWAERILKATPSPVY
jgi:hypothetical protein